MNCFYKLGLAASYDRVMGLKGLLAGAVCKLFEQQGQVCPSSLRKFLFTVGALDNIDHNPSATCSRFISWYCNEHFPVPNCIKPWFVRDPMVVEPSQSGKYSLPDKYTNVPAVSGRSSNFTVSEYIPPSDNSGVLDAGKAEEENGLHKVCNYLTK